MWSALLALLAVCPPALGQEEDTDEPSDHAPHGPVQDPDHDEHSHDELDPDDEWLFDDGDEIVVHSHAQHPEPDRGAGDLHVLPHEVQAVDSPNAADALQLAPSVFVTRTGNDVHPEQIFLRGFDARHGQDVAMRIDGAPLNQVGNPHGHGLVDLHFIPSEALAELRVQEGPFSPTQGDFAVAGSVDLELGLAEPGLMFKAQGGSFGTGRGVVGWQHPHKDGTLAIAEVFRTRGYGDNRGAQKGSALFRVEGGEDTRWHLLASGYGAAWDFAGTVRLADVEAERIDLYGTQDDHQGGSYQQGLLAFGVEERTGDTAWRVHAGLAQRHQRLRTNFTGFLTDDRRAGESQHDQRGDLTEQDYLGTTASLEANVLQELYDGPFGSVARLTGGVVGRYDDVLGHTWRVADLDLAPYRVEADYRLQQAQLAGLVEGELDGGALVVRAGARANSLVYELTDFCGARDEWFPGAETDDVNCPDESRNGVRLRQDARTAQGLGIAPSASLLWKPWPEQTLSLAVGRGLRSLEALSLSEDEDSPFGSLWSGELGWLWKRAADNWTGTHSVAAFGTVVDRDLIFDEEQVRNVVAGETYRVGASASSEVRVGAFTERTTVSYTYAVFGDDLAPSYSRYNTDRQPGKLVPYVPPLVARTDLLLGGRVGERIDRAAAGVAIDYISPRPLPQSERSSPVFTVDVQGEVRKGPVQLGVTVTNVLNARYPLAEYNFASWFPEVSGQAYPTRIATRHVAPGAPRAVMATVTIYPGVSP